MLAQELLQQREVEHRLGDGVLGAGLDLVFEAADFLVDVGHAGIGADADDERGGRADGIAAEVEAAIEIGNDVDQSDGVHVEDGGGVGIVAQLRADRR